MGSVNLSNVQFVNLSNLVTIRDSVKQDRVSASCQFGLSEAQASYFGNLSFNEILNIVANLGDECLFPPRQDLLLLLNLPLPLARPVTSVHPPQEAAFSAQRTLHPQPSRPCGTL